MLTPLLARAFRFFIALQAHSRRLAELGSLRETLHELWATLALPRESEFEEVGDELTESRKEAFASRIVEAETIKGRRRAEVTQMAEDINALWDEMCFEPKTDVDKAIREGATELPLTEETLASMTEQCSTLTKEKVRREERVKALGAEIAALWDRLKVPEDDRTAWLDSHQGLGDAVIEACESKLAALRSEMQAKLASIIEDARTTIHALWDELHFGESERVFDGLDTPQTAFDDDVLAAHEAHIDKLNEELANLRPILRAIAKRAAILEDRVEYEQLIADPSRLLSRGRADAARRIREAKLERRVKKELPAVTAKLKTNLNEWTEEHGRPFLYDGVDILAAISSEEAGAKRAAAEAKAQKEADKKAAREAASNPFEGGDGATKPTRAAGKFRSAARAATLKAGGRRRAAAAAGNKSSTLPMPRKGKKADAHAKVVPEGATDALRSSSRPNTAGSRIPGVSSKAGKTGKAKLKAAAATATEGGTARSRRGAKAGLRGAVAAMMSGIENES